MFLGLMRTANGAAESMFAFSKGANSCSLCVSLADTGVIILAAVEAVEGKFERTCAVQAGGTGLITAFETTGRRSREYVK
jgi:hypothetical protein